MKKYGIFGGSFNPIHYGHLMICEYIKEEMGLDKVIFIPTGNPPHKDLELSAEDRYEMVRLAISPNPDFEISDIETTRVEKSYTVDTIRELKKIYKEEKLYFLIGLDSLFQLKTWMKIGDLSQEIEFVVALRPGYLVKTPLYEISSTDLRDRIREGKSLRYLIPKKVLDYIEESGFYKVDL